LWWSELVQRAQSALNTCDTISARITCSDSHDSAARGEPTLAFNVWYRKPATWRISTDNGSVVTIQDDPNHHYRDEHGQPAGLRPEDQATLRLLPWEAFTPIVDSLMPLADTEPLEIQVAGRPCHEVVLVADGETDRTRLAIDIESGLIVAWSAVDAPFFARVERIDFNSDPAATPPLR